MRAIHDLTQPTSAAADPRADLAVETSTPRAVQTGGPVVTDIEAARARRALRNLGLGG